MTKKKKQDDDKIPGLRERDESDSDSDSSDDKEEEIQQPIARKKKTIGWMDQVMKESTKRKTQTVAFEVEEKK